MRVVTHFISSAPEVGQNISSGRLILCGPKDIVFTTQFYTTFEPVREVSLSPVAPTTTDYAIR